MKQEGDLEGNIRWAGCDLDTERGRQEEGGEGGRGEKRIPVRRERKTKSV